MKKNFSALLFGMLLAISALPANAAPPDKAQTIQADYFAKQLDNFVVGKKPAMYIIERVDDKLEKDPTMLAVSYKWVKGMTEVKDTDQFNSLYFMLRSDLAHRLAKDAKTARNAAEYKTYGLDALQSILDFEMLLMSDAARCKNLFDDSIIGELLKPRYDTLGQYVYSFLPPSQMPQLWDEALQVEVKNKGRLPNKEICSNGALIGLRLMEDAPKSKIPESVEPEFVTDDEWEVARDHLRYSIKDFWKDRYESRTQRAIKK